MQCDGGDKVKANPPNDDAADMTEDRICFVRTVAAFRQYTHDAMHLLEGRYQQFALLSPRHRQLLGLEIDAIFSAYRTCVYTNDQLLQAICSTASDLFSNYWPNLSPTTVLQQQPKALDMDKAFSTLRQIARDWSAAGKIERDAVYKPIIDFLSATFPDRNSRSSVRVLNPGAGLCRLSVELALCGFSCQSNEFSYHMLIAGHFLQNHTNCSDEFQLHPFCDVTCNLVHREDQFAAVLVPDLCAGEEVQRLQNEGLHFGELSMVAGDFLEVYAKPDHQGAWNAIATCFFIDTAHNVIEYLEVMHTALCTGGIWVNIGPLLYHFADEVQQGGSQSETPKITIELSLSEVLAVANRVGFELLGQPRFVDTTYAANQRSMKQLVYRCAFFAMRKR